MADEKILEPGAVAVDRAKLLKLRAWIDALIQADDALAEKPPENPEPVDVEAWKTSVRNRVLAGSGEKAALMGTLSTAPAVTALDAEGCGLDKLTAAAVIAERDAQRAAALALVK